MEDKIKGLVTEIQRYSIHDGPGIRTVVFFKGCFLNCLWCCNPETINSQPELMIVHEKCIKCERCIKACPVNSVYFEGENIKIDRGRRPKQYVI